MSENEFIYLGIFAAGMVVGFIVARLVWKDRVEELEEFRDRVLFFTNKLPDPPSRD